MVKINNTPKSYIFWLIGLPCSGKTTLASSLYSYLKIKNKKIIFFDGDILRKGINKDLGFSKKDRDENIRRTVELVKIFHEEGYTIIVSQITPLNQNRNLIKKAFGETVKIIYVECDLKTCINRDVKGMYKKAMNGEIKDFTGIDSKFEIPKNINLLLNTSNEKLPQTIKKIENYGDKFINSN
jgi:adenylylsulfate kinase